MDAITLIIIVALATALVGLSIFLAGLITGVKLTRSHWEGR